ncbi:SAM-dependent methyltransferase [Candidatus Protochlamydia phocaeensis]|uniref:SAM-dependent methyltransferase n=1 Tax=Candidatus Protochlamydia phocaeensis TaxID=1414722 RepID=UPI000837F602|nr:class I SAM-dependent methyltransferase [Candidatus Protochlamydia phocaeensis]
MKAKWKSAIELVWINLKVSLNSFVEYVRVVFNYYSDPLFCKVDSALVFPYLFHNPFAVSKQFLQQKGADNVYTYGETPLTTLDLIARRCHLSLSDTVFELGCGRGRTCFWLNRFIGCQVVGVDYVPAFIERAQAVQAKWRVKGVEFRLENILATDFTGATVIYLYGTCYSASFISLLARRLESLPKGAKVISISYPLTDYQTKPLFEVVSSFSAPFTWGAAEVYLQIRK